MITGEALRNYMDNVKDASAIHFVHGLGFKEVDWKKYDKNSPIISDESKREDGSTGKSA